MAAVPWFDSLEPGLRDWLRSKMEPLSLESGQALFAAGAPSDCLYLVTRGALGAFAPGDASILIGQVVAGETVGELGLVTQRPRTATVRALRDTGLLRLSPEGFDSLCRAHPEAVLALARVVLERAQRPLHQRLAAHPRTIALLPQRDGLHLDAFARWLAEALGGDPKVAIVHRADAPTDDALDALERDRFVIYLAHPEDDQWRKRCLRQVLVDGGVMNNLPVDVMRDGLVDDVIAVDIGADNGVVSPLKLEEFELPSMWRVVWDWFTGTRRPSLAKLMLGSGMVNSTAATFAARAASSLVLTPPVSDIDLLDWDSFDLAVERGYESTCRALEDQP